MTEYSLSGTNCEMWDYFAKIAKLCTGEVTADVLAEILETAERGIERIKEEAL